MTNRDASPLIQPADTTGRKPPQLDLLPEGFEEAERLRSAFIRQVAIAQVARQDEPAERVNPASAPIPKLLIRYWHDHQDLPDDVRVCLDSWDRLKDEGFELLLFDDCTAATYIERACGEREARAFERCDHPAMRSDYFRLCFVLNEGGFYVDADDVLLGDGWRSIYRDDRLKVQPLCYDLVAGAMAEAADIWRPEIRTDDRVFYVNNDPIASPANHPVVRRALVRATAKLLTVNESLEIQATTGPGNLTAALAAHAREQWLAGHPFDFELLHDWDEIAEMRWDLSYRSDSRNWRNVYGC